VGIGLGLGIGVIIVAGYFTLAAGRLDAANLRELAASRGFGKPAIFLAFAAYITLVNALLEEYVWRWFVFTRCERLLPGRWAVLVAAACFTLHHVFVLRSFAPWSLTLLGAVGVFVGGTAWNWCYLRYRSIWPGYVSHAVADAAILALGWHLLFGSA
jgi:membrane protease YdiL (CAAX protease family)